MSVRPSVCLSVTADIGCTRIYADGREFPRRKVKVKAYAWPLNKPNANIPNKTFHLGPGLMKITISCSTTKTKEMILGPLAHTNLPLLSTPTGTIDRVTSFTLLGLHIDSSLSWANHISIITKKASSRLYFLKQLRRAGLASNDLLHFSIAVIRPVLEYCAPVWHCALTQAQTQELEAIQKRAIHHIIFQFSRGMSYSNMLFASNLTSLASRRNELSVKFFSQNYQSCILSPPFPPPAAIQFSYI